MSNHTATQTASAYYVRVRTFAYKIDGVVTPSHFEYIGAFDSATEALAYANDVYDWDNAMVEYDEIILLPLKKIGDYIVA